MITLTRRKAPLPPRHPPAAPPSASPAGTRSRARTGPRGRDRDQTLRYVMGTAASPSSTSPRALPRTLESSRSCRSRRTYGGLRGPRRSRHVVIEAIGSGKTRAGPLGGPRSPRHAVASVAEITRWSPSSPRPPDLWDESTPTACSTRWPRRRRRPARPLLVTRWTACNCEAARAELAATDGRQLLVQGGFTFPWAGDLLVGRLHPALCGARAAAGRRLRGSVGRASSSPSAAGPWAIWLATRTGVPVPRHRPRPSRPRVPAQNARLRLHPADALFLADAAPNNCRGPTTRTRPRRAPDLNGVVAVRVRGGVGSATELVLARSSYAGPPARAPAMNREYLGRTAAASSSRSGWPAPTPPSAPATAGVLTPGSRWARPRSWARPTTPSGSSRRRLKCSRRPGSSPPRSPRRDRKPRQVVGPSRFGPPRPAG